MMGNTNSNDSSNDNTPLDDTGLTVGEIYKSNEFIKEVVNDTMDKLEEVVNTPTGQLVIDAMNNANENCNIVDTECKVEKFVDSIVDSIENGSENKLMGEEFNDSVE